MEQTTMEEGRGGWGQGWTGTWMDKVRGVRGHGWTGSGMDEDKIARVRGGQCHRWMGAGHGAGTAMHGLGQQVSRTGAHPSSFKLDYPPTPRLGL